MADAHVDHDSPEYIKKQVKTYAVIGAVLLLATVCTVLAAQLDLPREATLYLGISIAAVKATLVAAFFMHLIDERKIIYASLAVTVCMFAVLISVPIFTEGGSVAEDNAVAEKVKAKAAADKHKDKEEGGHH